MDDEQQVEKCRKEVTRRIAIHSDELIDSLFELANNQEIEAKVRLTAISILLDRGVPKLGIEHTKPDAGSESGGRKAVRDEIEALLKGGN